MESHPENEGGKYTVILQNPLYLGATWEMGLSEIVYHRDWDNVPMGENEIKLEYRSGWSEDYWGDMHKLRTKYLNDINFFKESEIIETSIPPQTIHTSYTVPLPEDLKYSHHFLATKLRDLLNEIFTIKSKMDNTITFLASLDRQNHNLIITPTWTGGTKPPNDTRQSITLQFPESWIKLFILENESLTIPLDGPPTKLHYGGYLKTFPYAVPLDYLKPEFKVIRIPPKRYSTNIEFITAIQNAIADASLDHLGTLTVDLVSGSQVNESIKHVIIQFTPGKLVENYWKIHITHTLANMLGMTSKETIKDTSDNDLVLIHDHWTHLKDPFPEPPAPPKINMITFRGTEYINIDRGIDELWIYTDIIEPQLTGNGLSQLLRIVPVKGEPFGEGILIRYDYPHYMNLSTSMIQEINIRIMPSYGGNAIKFQQPVIITLHFRQKV